MERQTCSRDNKIPVDVDVLHTRASKKVPKVIYYEKRDGAVVANEVLRVLDERPAASEKAGLVGTRYLCMLNGRCEPTTLYWDMIGDKWFVERKGEK